MIEISNLSYSYDDTKTILEDFNLNIDDAKKIALLGASGSGKSTLLNLIAGFIAPSGGEISIDGVVVSKKGLIITPPHKREIAYIFQDLALWEHMSVAENIGFALKMKKLDKKMIKKSILDILNRLGLKGYENRSIDELSGGQRQRVAIARAIVTKPKILLMDEAMSNLDESLKDDIIDFINNLHKELGFILIYVTHNKDEAKKIANKIIYLNTRE